VPTIVARGGGAAAIRRCGQVVSDPFQTQVVAWHLDLRQEQVVIDKVGHGTVIAPKGTGLARDPGLPIVATSPRWVLASSCPPAGG
jgi:hypothetical protein